MVKSPGESSGTERPVASPAARERREDTGFLSDTDDRAELGSSLFVDHVGLAGVVAASEERLGDGGRENHGVDDVNDAVAGLDVGHDDGGVVNHDVAVDDGDVDLLALDRGGGLAVEGDGGFGIDCSSNDVIRQDVGEGGVAEEFFGGEAESIEGGGEGVVGQREAR